MKKHIAKLVWMGCWLLGAGYCAYTALLALQEADKFDYYFKSKVDK